MKFLTIKKEHYEAILSGEKRKEWRSISKRNNFLLSYDFEHIGFHYYRKNRIICQVKKIRKVKTPSFLLGSHGLDTEHCICIDLGFTFERIKD